MKRKEQIKKLDADLEYVINILSHAPEGNIVIRKLGGVSLYVDHGKKGQHEQGEKYLSKDDPSVKKYLNARYCRKLKPIIEKNLRALEKFEKNYHPEKMKGIYASYPDVLKKMITPLACDIEGQGMIWSTENYLRNGYEINGGYRTKRGDIVRSKAEYIVADILYDMDLSYRYEMIYEGRGWRTYPDFTVMHPESGELYYIEYFGMMSDPDYLTDAIKKIDRYQNTPDAAHFVYFFESADNQMNPDGIRNTLKKVFFC